MVDRAFYQDEDVGELERFVVEVANEDYSGHFLFTVVCVPARGYVGVIFLFRYFDMVRYD